MEADATFHIKEKASQHFIDLELPLQKSSYSMNFISQLRDGLMREGVTKKIFNCIFMKVDLCGLEMVLEREVKDKSELSTKSLLLMI